MRLPWKGAKPPYEDWLRQYFYPHDLFSASFGRLDKAQLYLSPTAVFLHPFGRLAKPILPIPRHGFSPPFRRLGIAQFRLSTSAVCVSLTKIGYANTSIPMMFFPPFRQIGKANSAYPPRRLFFPFWEIGHNLIPPPKLQFTRLFHNILSAFPQLRTHFSQHVIAQPIRPLPRLRNLVPPHRPPHAGNSSIGGLDITQKKLQKKFPPKKEKALRLAPQS